MTDLVDITITDLTTGQTIAEFADRSAAVKVSSTGEVFVRNGYAIPYMVRMCRHRDLVAAIQEVAAQYDADAAVQHLFAALIARLTS
jgi:hypothetical protein